MHGQAVCKVHGGASPQAKAAAARRLQRERLEGGLGRLLAELEVDAADRNPVELLLDAVHRCAAMVQILGALVGDLEAGELYGPDHLGDGRPHVATEMYAMWLERAARASKLAIDAGVEERYVAAAERYAAEIADVLRRVVAALGHDPNTPEVRAIIREQLTAASAETGWPAPNNGRRAR
jgi:hypothetical protein